MEDPSLVHPAAVHEPAPDEPTADADADSGDDDDVAAPEDELARRAALATNLAKWTLKTIDRFPSTFPAGGGLYIVVKGDVPIYVGEATSFLSRWHGRLLSQYQMGLLDKGSMPVAARVTVWFARIAHNTKATRKTVEHAIVRTLTQGGLGGALRNSRSIRAFDVDGSIVVANLLPAALATALGSVSGYDKATNTLTLAAKTRFELELEDA